MKLDFFIKHFPEVRMTREQIAACRYLESRGLRFCIDFGYENAFDKAFDSMDDGGAFQ
jgi:hypothetical protein